MNIQKKGLTIFIGLKLKINKLLVYIMYYYINFEVPNLPPG